MSKNTQPVWEKPTTSDFIVLSGKIRESTFAKAAKELALKGESWSIRMNDCPKAIMAETVLLQFTATAGNGRKKIAFIDVPIEAVKKLGSEFGYGPGFYNSNQLHTR